MHSDDHIFHLTIYVTCYMQHFCRQCSLTNPFTDKRKDGKMDKLGCPTENTALANGQMGQKVNWYVVYMRLGLSTLKVTVWKACKYRHTQTHKLKLNVSREILPLLELRVNSDQVWRDIHIEKSHWLFKIWLIYWFPPS